MSPAFPTCWHLESWIEPFTLLLALFSTWTTILGLRGPVDLGSYFLVSRDEVKSGFRQVPWLPRWVGLPAGLSTANRGSRSLWLQCASAVLSLGLPPGGWPRTWPHHANMGKRIQSDRYQASDPFLESRLLISWKLTVLLGKENYSVFLGKMTQHLILHRD